MYYKFKKNGKSNNPNKKLCERTQGPEIRSSHGQNPTVFCSEGFMCALSYIAALFHLKTIAGAPVGACVRNRRQPKSMGLILMTRQDLLNVSL